LPGTTRTSSSSRHCGRYREHAKLTALDVLDIYKDQCIVEQRHRDLRTGDPDGRRS
jgi:hypothetical protein